MPVGKPWTAPFYASLAWNKLRFPGAIIVHYFSPADIQLGVAGSHPCGLLLRRSKPYHESPRVIISSRTMHATETAKQAFF